MTAIRKVDNTKYWRGYGPWKSLHCWWGYKLYNHSGKQSYTQQTHSWIYTSRELAKV